MSNSTLSSVSPPGQTQPHFEIKFVHPAVAQWLEERGYTYKHEVQMPEFGRADFVAKHPDGTILVVECKSSLEHSAGYACVQVIDYSWQLDCGAIPVLAAPQDVISDKAYEIARKRGVQIIALDMPSEGQTIEIISYQNVLTSAQKRLTTAYLPLNRILSADVHDESVWEQAFDRVFEGGVEFVSTVLPALVIRTSRQDARSEMERFLVRHWQCSPAQEEHASQVVSWCFEENFHNIVHLRFLIALKKALSKPLIWTQYNVIMDEIRRGLWKRTTEELKQELNLDEKDSLRDNLTAAGLAYETLAEELSALELSQNNNLEFNDADQIVRSNSEFVGQHAEKASRRLNIDIPTGRPLLSGKTESKE